MWHGVKTGMLLTANEGRQQHAFFIPQLGPAPKWCSFLDNLVEEMAEDPNDPSAFASQSTGETYDNYKFLTMQQLETLNLSHLVGTTSLLRPYMHGYFVAQRLYEEAKLIADPSVWEERSERVKAKIDSERESRIRGNKKVVAKVNQRLAEKIIDRVEKNELRRAKRVLKKGGDDNTDELVNEATGEIENEAAGLLADPRFAKLFQDEDFAIDETSKEFQSMNPSTRPAPVPKGSRDRPLTAVEEEALDGNPASATSDSSTDEEDTPAPKVRDSGRISSSSYKRSGHQPQNPQMIVSSSKKPLSSQDRSFASRVKQQKHTKTIAVRTIGGEREITFMPEKKRKALTIDEKKDNNQRRDKGRRSASGNVFRAL